jgi:hypothetical protein
VKQNKHAEACERYFEVINTLRFSDKYKNTSEGKQLEQACRLNIAVCKAAMGEHASVIDQCERVLSSDAGNWKALYRMAVAMYEVGKGKAIEDRGLR